MPWCEECAKYYTPNSLPPDGTCPSCGTALGEEAAPDGTVADDEKAPWHFKLLVTMTAAYLIWRVLDWIVV